MTPVESRRQRLRRELTAEIVTVASRQLDEGGPSAVSWRGIATEVGMNPASLYTYVDGMEDLFTRVLLESFQQLAAHVTAAVDPQTDPRTRLLACSRAYRAWAVAHPRQFNLLFTDQIPGYRAPAAGATLEAELAIFRPMVDAVSELTQEDFSIEHLTGGTTLTLDLKATVYGLFAALHGFVMLEINNHAPVLSGSDEVLITHMTRAMDEVAARAATRRAD